MSRNEDGKAQPPEKFNFTRRCSLLSRYLKEKGSFGNIDLGLVRKPEDLRLPGNSDQQDKQNVMHKANSEIKALNVLGEPSSLSGGKAKATNLSEPSDPGSSQLTIFFGGKVLVYNEFPSDKAKEIIQVAKQAKPVTEVNVQNNNKSNMVLPDLNEPSDSADVNQQQQQQNQLVERIARRASLHRFFAKRKDRAVARAPYQVNQNAGRHHYPPKPDNVPGQQLEQGQSSQRPAQPKPECDKDMLMEVKEEGQCSKDLELRL
ncbi:Protein TIFY 11A [Raphanus sativus]|uniref:Protein TIFY n=1 Tax=Raphanus sativus TaxID=3726 RepID=A0A9W3CT66_RAPSA|nr:protein TIFY 11A-like [Raphanus sativus]KAJ4869632.1 Protein TIFY 11A [Raphanus sativus]